MRLYPSIMIILFLIASAVTAQEKNVDRNFKVNPNQRVFINGISSIQVKIKGGDNNEGNIKINVKINSSDSRFANEYLQNFDVTYKTDGNDIIIDFIETPKQGKWSVLDIFKGDFKYSFSKLITGEIILPKGVNLIGDFKYSDISVSGFDQPLSLKGKGNHFSIKDCARVNDISNEYGDVTLINSGGRLNAELKISPITIDSFEGAVKVTTSGSSATISNINGKLGLNAYNTKAAISDISGDVSIYSEISDLTIKQVKGYLQIYDKTGKINVYDAGTFKLEGNKSDFSADRIASKDKIFFTTKGGTYRITNSSAPFYIDDDNSVYNLNDVTGPLFYSASNSRLTGKDLNGDWKSDTRFTEISIEGISAQKIEAAGRGKLFKGVLSGNPKKVEIKNQEADILLSLDSAIKTSLFMIANHGSLKSDFPVRVINEEGISKAAERINGGGAVISLETKDGNIKVIKH